MLEIPFGRGRRYLGITLFGGMTNSLNAPKSQIWKQRNSTEYKFSKLPKANEPYRRLSAGNSSYASLYDTSNSDSRIARAFHDNLSHDHICSTRRWMANFLSPRGAFVKPLHPLRRSRLTCPHIYSCISDWCRPFGCTLCPHIFHSIRRRIHRTSTLFRTLSSSLPRREIRSRHCRSRKSFPDSWKTHLIQIFNVSPFMNTALRQMN